jgi:hypothetical protein
MTKKKKIILSISSILLVLILYGWLFGAQTCLALFVRWRLSEPGYSMVPQLMKIERSSTPAREFSAFDYQLSVPWENMQECFSSTSIVSWVTSSSNIMVICFPQQENAYSPMIDHRSGGKKHRDDDAFIKALGVEGLTHTNYHLYLRMWNTTAQDISFFESRSEMAIKTLFLTFKAIAAPSVTSSNVYYFETSSVKGVQAGNPAVDRSVYLNLFDHLDREIRFIVVNRSEIAGAVDQADINTIITTFKVDP